MVERSDNSSSSIMDRSPDGVYKLFTIDNKQCILSCVSFLPSIKITLDIYKKYRQVL